ncbi:hypothetical protein HHK36_030145 [Tetracentron sinense]|uniref:Uncharacterized protein n=1 Tax=Tetracentron sinense TaxID=13715 RepID=A0A834YF08_TETSI|nr:hypothetical protein HHK36_030145 [Tetracentron sinense]
MLLSGVDYRKSPQPIPIISGMWTSSRSCFPASTIVSHRNQSSGMKIPVIKDKCGVLVRKVEKEESVWTGELAKINEHGRVSPPPPPTNIKLHWVEGEMAEAMGTPHALVIPLPAQGHVIPLMELSYLLAERGFRITFVNTEFIHERIMTALPEDSTMKNQIHLVSIPDGMGLGEDRNQFGKLLQCISRTMPNLEKLIESINESCKDKITCIIADESMGWAVKVVKKMGIPQAAFWPASASLRALIVRIPDLIEAGVIDANGISRKQEMIQLSSTMPVMDTTQLTWHRFDDPMLQQTIFQNLFTNNQAVKDAD